MTAHATVRSTLLPLVLLALSCGSSGSDRTTRNNKPPGTVVARVNGIPIAARDVALMMADEGVTARAALDRLIRLELFFQQAKKRESGLSSSPRMARTKAMVRQLVEQDFGQKFTKASIPLELVKQSYENNLQRFKHPETLKVFHVLAQARRIHPAIVHQRALAAAQRVYQLALARKPLTAKKMAEIHQQVRPTARVPMLAQPFFATRRGRVAREFATAAFALAAPGDVSPPVKTRFGYHVIVLLKRYPAINRSLADADAEIRQRIFEDARRIMFDRYARGIERRFEAKLSLGRTNTGDRR